MWVVNATRSWPGWLTSPTRFSILSKWTSWLSWSWLNSHRPFEFSGVLNDAWKNRSGNLGWLDI
jgi:hypothetical protein